LTQSKGAADVREKPCADDRAGNAHDEIYEEADAASFGDSGAEPAKEDSHEDAGYQAGLGHRTLLPWWKALDGTGIAVGN